MIEIPDWYNVHEDYIIVNPVHKSSIEEAEKYTNVAYLEFIQKDQIIFVKKCDYADSYRPFLDLRNEG